MKEILYYSIIFLTIPTAIFLFYKNVISGSETLKKGFEKLLFMAILAMVAYFIYYYYRFLK